MRVWPGDFKYLPPWNCPAFLGDFVIVLKPGDSLTLKNIYFDNKFFLKYWTPGKLYILNDKSEVAPEKENPLVPNINDPMCCLELVKFWE